MRGLLFVLVLCSLAGLGTLGLHLLHLATKEAKRRDAPSQQCRPNWLPLGDRWIGIGLAVLMGSGLVALSVAALSYFACLAVASLVYEIRGY